MEQVFNTANGMDGEAEGYTFQWKIENISQCWWLKKDEYLESPAFVADSIHDTKWRLWLYPMGTTGEEYVGFYLHREENCCGPYFIAIKYNLALLDKNGAFFGEMTTKDSFSKGDFSGYTKFETLERIFVTEKEAVLPEDTLTVQCTIWKKKPIKSKHLYAQTVLKTNRKSFKWRIDNIPCRKFASRYKLKDYSVDFDLVLNEKLGFEKEIVIIMNSYDECLKYFSFKTSIIDSEGKRKKGGWKEYFIDDLKKGVLSFTWNFPEYLMEDKNLYLPNDNLSLYCEFVFGTITDGQDSFGSGVISTELTNEHHEEGNSQNTTVLVDDLKSLFHDGIFSDMELRTSTQSFPVHMGILSARSPVFQRMFSSDMKEKNSGHVDITDFEDDIVRRMLLYIYTDSLEDLQCESACKLYAAADKYDIKSLKSKCSSFLKENLCQAIVCNILILADQHQDNDLKMCVQDYILNHDEVFSTTEWMQLMTTNLKLAADVMYRKINHGKILPCNV